MIPVLSMDARSLVKTVRFHDPTYLGDPMNALRILNTKQVDEVVILDITASDSARSPDLGFLAELVAECFSPVAFGGGIRSLAVVEAVLKAGVEKVVLDTIAHDDLDVVVEAARAFGSQAVVGGLDVERRAGRPELVRTGGPHVVLPTAPVEWTARLEDAGVGEILVTSIDRDGTSTGYDLELVAEVASARSVPVVANGGAGSLDDLRAGLRAGASGVAAGRLFTTRGKHFASLVSYPAPEEIEALAS